MKHTWFLVLALYLGLHQGYLALWSSQSATPATVFPYRASLYPKMDQSELAEGIPVENEDQLRQLLEDFLS